MEGTHVSTARTLQFRTWSLDELLDLFTNPNNLDPSTRKVREVSSQVISGRTISGICFWLSCIRKPIAPARTSTEKYVIIQSNDSIPDPRLGQDKGQGIMDLNGDCIL